MHELDLVAGPIDPAKYLAGLATESEGALVSFAGIVRRMEGSLRLSAIDYEAYAPMAESELRRLLDEAETRFGPIRARVVHRTGVVPVGEASVWIGVASGHREAAFEAARFLIDELKARVPIWKREHRPERG